MMISVVIPTWNRKTQLRKAINSVLCQTYPAYEILVCDDGSTDDTKAMVKSLARHDTRIKWIEGEHSGGPARPRNNGIREAEGEWVAFLDSDDVWLSNKLSRQLECAKAGNYSFVCSNAYSINNQRNQRGLINDKLNSNLSLSGLLKGNKVICSTVMVKKSLIEEVGCFPEENDYIAIEDYLTWLKIATRSRIGYDSEPLVTYHDNPVDSIRSRWKTFLEQKLVALKYIKTWLVNNPRVSFKTFSSFFTINREMKLFKI